ncbi:MAG: M48 family metalloprotease [Acidobacteria bacterium]|nr:M48 family metalloprotease [Acidobacteriota bacterium]
MNRQSPKRFTLAILSLALLLASFNAAEAQRKRSTKEETTTVGSPVNAILDLGSSMLNSATSYVDVDPYSQFREQQYSNEGLLSERDEIKLGNTIHLEVQKRYKIVADGQARLNRIGQRIARASRRPGLAYQFHVIRDKELNAFSTPGGHIYVTTALMDIASDDQLSSVLAHEVGHVVARHSLKTLQQTQMLGGIADLIGSVTGIAGDTAQQLGTLAAQLVGSGLLSVHNREEEREADFLGVHTMAKAGYDTEAMISMFQKILNVGERDSSLLNELFSDHPAVQERIDNTRYEIDHMRNSRRR